MLGSFEPFTNEENPLPALQPAHSIHPLVDGGHHDASKHGSDLAGCSEECRAFGDFIGLVP